MAISTEKIGLIEQARTLRKNRGFDIVLASCIGVAAAAYAVRGFLQLDFIHLASAYDTWFDADVRRMVGACEARHTLWHYRTSVHPLYALLISLPCISLRKIGFTSWEAAAALVAFSAFVFAFSFYFAARVTGLDRVCASLSAALMLSTSASMFWLATPETYSLGAATMLLALVWLGSRRGHHDRYTGPLQSALTLSITITNWMAGLLAALLALGIRRAINVSLVAFVAVASLNSLQKLIFPRAGLFFEIGKEQEFMLPTEREPISTRLLSFVGQPILAPKTELRKVHSGNIGVVAKSAIDHSPSLITWAAAAGWIALLASGVVAAAQGRVPQVLVIFLFAVLAGQIALHMLYGTGLFLYALHFAPFVVLIACLGCTSRWRGVVIALMAFTIPLTLAHNVPRFIAAADLLRMTTTDPQFIENYMK